MKDPAFMNANGTWVWTSRPVIGHIPDTNALFIMHDGSMIGFATKIQIGGQRPAL